MASRGLDKFDDQDKLTGDQGGTTKFRKLKLITGTGTREGCGLRRCAVVYPRDGGLAWRLRFNRTMLITIKVGQVSDR